MRLRVPFIPVRIAMLTAVLGSFGAAFAAIPTNVTIRNYFGSLTFNRPVEVAAVPGFDSTFVVLEQWLNGSTTVGQITLVRSVAGTWTKSAFDTVTFSGSVTTTREMGLLSLAFHPNYAQNRKYYVGYTPSYNNATNPTGRYLVVERVADSTRLQRDAAVASKTLISVTLTGNSQIGGGLTFGPQDGYLYVGIGDGGGTGDPQGYAQNADSLQGKILRINVNAADAGKNYAVPADNPFVGVTGKKPEVWALGLRHPWRFTFHPVRNDLWVGELGTNIQDEISIVPKSGNMGWPTVEGGSCYPSTVTNCTKTGFTTPLYTRAAQVLIGGQFFMGDSAGKFNDTYLFGMWETGVVFGMRYTNGAIADQPVQIATVTNVSVLAKDNRGRILAARLGTSGTGGAINANTGIVYVLESPDMIVSPATALRPGKTFRNSQFIRITPGELARHREQFDVKTLDGRIATGIPSGIFWVSRKGASGSAQLMSGVRE